MYETLTLGRPLVAVACLMFMIAPPASSQGTGPAQPFDAAGGSGLRVTFGASEALESELQSEVRSRVAQGGLQSGGLSTMLTASADYARNRRLLQLTGNASTAFIYQQRLDLLAAVSHRAGLGATVRLPKQGSLRIDQTAAYTPSFLYRLFPGGALPDSGALVPSGPDFRIDEITSYSYGTGMALAFGSPRGTRVTTTADYNHTDFEARTVTRTDWTTYAAGTSLSRAVSRNVGLSVGYQYRIAEFGLGRRTKEHRLAMGADYSRALSASRRATFYVNVVPAMFDIPESALAADDASPGPTALEGRRYRLQGEAGLVYQFRLNWQVAASYRRLVEYLEVLTEPVFSDGARVGLTGLVTRRVGLSVAAGYATGASAISRGGGHLDTYTGDLTLSYALGRSFALYSKYLYYYYDLGGQARLAPDLPSVFERHGVRVGFVLFARALGARGEGS